MSRNVQVTLQIIKALIEKAPRDLPLYAPYVLQILMLILRSKDITMVEASIPTFEAFCEHHDGASLSGDQEYLQQYGEVIRIYASFASTRPQPVKVQPSAPVAMRWRKAGLHAILSVSSSEALASVAGRQLDTVMPVVLENLWTENDDYLFVLQERAQLEGNGENDKLLRRRMSSSTVRTVDTSDANAAALSGSTADADKLAEEDLGVLAMYCLKQLFEANNRSQIRNATIQTLAFVAERVSQGEKAITRDAATGEARGWAPALFVILAKWTPMQDRYVILVTAVETLVQSPLQEQNMKQQLVLATVISSLLRSDINLIGLSVMDVLLGLIQHVLRILQLGGTPHSQQKETINEANQSSSSAGNPITELVAAPSASRRLLLAQLQNCIGDLATHIYYADQVSVMIKAILVRLKPSPISEIPTPAAAIEDPQTTTNVISASGNLTEDHNTDGFFSFDTAKVIAINSVKQILLVANHRGKISGGATLGRNQVSVHVWEGTQWLLRDSDPRVRRAYADALLTWLDLETTKVDSKAFDHQTTPPKAARGREESVVSQKIRVVSNSSQREKSGGSTTFLQLLHLAIYENALQFVVSEPDMVMLHILLANLVSKLGVNAVHSGLPMIFRLQEDIQDVEEPSAKIRIGSLCHGYFLVLAEKFDFENTAIGREILNEIERRRRKGFWIPQIQTPPPRLSKVAAFSTARQTFPLHDIASESLKPFDDRFTMVECIAEAYAESVASPPPSAPNSPGRTFNMPILSTSPTATTTNDHDLPTKLRNDMLSEWSRESAIAAAQEIGRSGSKSGSPAGSRSETQTGSRNFLGVNGNANGGTSTPQLRNGRSPSQGYGLVGALNKLRRTSAHESSPTRAGSVSSHRSTTRVDQLKKALTNTSVGVPVSRGHQSSTSDASSESMVSYNFTASEMSFGQQQEAPPGTARVSTNERSRSKDRTSGLAISGDASGEITIDQYLDEIEDNVPPVPPLPPNFSQGSPTVSANGSAANVNAAPLSRDGLAASNGKVSKSRGGSGGNHDAWGLGGAGGGGAVDSGLGDLESMLRGIGTGDVSGQRGLVARDRPPY